MFSLPTFNLTVNAWRSIHNPLVDPPDTVEDCNLAWGRRASVPASGGTSTVGVVFTAMTLLLPPLSDVRDGLQPGTGADVVEVPAGSGRFYDVLLVDDIGKGFPNEHRCAVVLKSVLPGLQWPTPYP